MMTNETLEEQLARARDKFNMDMVNWKLAKSELNKAEAIYLNSFAEINRIHLLIEGEKE